MWLRLLSAAQRGVGAFRTFKSPGGLMYVHTNLKRCYMGIKC